MSSLVSVIIPTHDRCFLLRRAVESVLDQTYANFECIVIDDGSRDKTQEVISKFKDDRIKYFRHEKNMGASAARNLGIRRANGELIAFLDDDDEWIATKLEKQVSLIKSLPESFGMIYCWMDYFDKGKLVHKHHPVFRGNVFGQVIDKQRIGGCPTLLVRRKVVHELGGFDELLARGNDGDFIRRVCQKFHVDLIPEVLVKVHVGHRKKRISDNDLIGVQRHIFSQYIKIQKFRSVFNQYPAPASAIYVDIALNLARLGAWDRSVYYLIRALSIRTVSSLRVRDFSYIIKNHWKKKFL